MAITDRCVVRNAAYRKAGLGIRERHNERKNAGYANTDIDPDRAALNVHFKQCEGTYIETFDRLEKDGVISTRGLKQDAKVMDEMVFDVNSAYFERGGGYKYAEDFFAEVYRLAVKEAGGEQYIVSAVMHADERNKALSEELGRDVYHYHLHVVYVPVVDKEVKWSKRCKDPALVGTTKEMIHQVSHSKKWASNMALDKDGSVIRNENGRAVLINAYSLLQDRYFEHMRAAGYHDFERGAHGSTTEHLSTLDYKVKQDIEKLDALEGAMRGKRQQAAVLDKTVAAKEKQVTSLERRFTVDEAAHAMYSELENMGKKDILGRIALQPDEWKKLLTFAKSGLSIKGAVEDLQRQLAAATKNTSIYKERWEELRSRTKDYLEVERLHPAQTRVAMETLKRLQQPEPPRNREQRRHQQER